MKEQELKAIFLDKLSDRMKNHEPNYKNYGIKKMAEGLHEEFDETWLRYRRGEVDFKGWDKSLARWLDAELLT